MATKEKEMTPEEELASIRERLKLLDPEASKRLAEAEAEAADEKKAVQDERTWFEKVRSEPHYWVSFNVSGPEDTEEVFLGCAGYDIKVQKGQLVPLPQSALNVADNAKIIGHRKVADQALGISYVRRFEYLRFPYSRFQQATPQEVADYRRKNAEAAAKEQQGSIGQEIAQQLAQQQSERNSVDTGPNPFTATPVGQ